MEKDYLFTCDKKHSWKSSDYPDKTLVGEIESEGWVDARDGLKCPECGTNDVGGKEINN